MKSSKVIVGVGVGIGIITLVALTRRAGAEPVPPETKYTRILGYIRDIDTGKPVPLVRPELMELGLVGEVSDGSGIYRIDDVPYLKGQTATYAVMFIPTWEFPNPQYEAATFNVEVGKFTDTRLDVELKCTWRPPEYEPEGSRALTLEEAEEMGFPIPIPGYEQYPISSRKMIGRIYGEVHSTVKPLGWTFTEFPGIRGVLVEQIEGIHKTTRTSSSGGYSISGMPYLHDRGYANGRFRFSHPDYEPKELIIRLSRVKSVQTNVSLNPIQ